MPGVLLDALAVQVLDAVDVGVPWIVAVVRPLVPAVHSEHLLGSAQEHFWGHSVRLDPQRPDGNPRIKLELGERLPEVRLLRDEVLRLRIVPGERLVELVDGGTAGD